MSKSGSATYGSRVTCGSFTFYLSLVAHIYCAFTMFFNQSILKCLHDMWLYKMFSWDFLLFFSYFGFGLSFFFFLNGITFFGKAGLTWSYMQPFTYTAVLIWINLSSRHAFMNVTHNAFNQKWCIDNTGYDRDCNFVIHCIHITTSTCFSLWQSLMIFKYIHCMIHNTNIGTSSKSGNIEATV